MECKYDLDDCFVSYALQKTQVDVCNLQLEILRNGGVWQFVGYTDLEGNPLKAFTFQNKFGGYSTCYKNAMPASMKRNTTAAQARNNPDRS